VDIKNAKKGAKSGRYEENKIGGPIRDYLKILGASKEDSRDTSNSARE
jgi:hypothetical protein